MVAQPKARRPSFCAFGVYIDNAPVIVWAGKGNSANACYRSAKTKRFRTLEMAQLYVFREAHKYTPVGVIFERKDHYLFGNVIERIGGGAGWWERPE